MITEFNLETKHFLHFARVTNVFDSCHSWGFHQGNNDHWAGNRLHRNTLGHHWAGNCLHHDTLVHCGSFEDPHTTGHHASCRHSPTPAEARGSSFQQY